MSEVSDKFLVDEIKDLRAKENLLKNEINELRNKIRAINFNLNSEYDKDNKILTVFLKTSNYSTCLKYNVKIFDRKIDCSPKYLYSDAIDFNTIIRLGNLLCPDDVTELFDCIWREEIQ